MENQQINSNNEADKVVGELQKDFKIVGSHRVHSWYAWAIIGIVLGMALGIIYVANRSIQVQESDAAQKKTIGVQNPLLSAPVDLSKTDALRFVETQMKERSIKNIVLQPAASMKESTLVFGGKTAYSLITASDWARFFTALQKSIQAPVPFELIAVAGGTPISQLFVSASDAAPFNSLVNVAGRQCKCQAKFDDVMVKTKAKGVERLLYVVTTSEGKTIGAFTKEEIEELTNKMEGGEGATPLLLSVTTETKEISPSCKVKSDCDSICGGSFPALPENKEALGAAVAKAMGTKAVEFSSLSAIAAGPAAPPTALECQAAPLTQ